jgi:hypothetical protein
MNIPVLTKNSLAREILYLLDTKAIPPASNNPPNIHPHGKLGRGELDPGYK